MIIHNSRSSGITAWKTGVLDPGRSRDGAVRFTPDSLFYLNLEVARRDPGTGWLRVLNRLYGAFNPANRGYLASHIAHLGCDYTQYGPSPRPHRVVMGRDFHGATLFVPPVEVTETKTLFSYAAPNGDCVFTDNLDTPITLDSVVKTWQKETEHVLYRMHWKSSRLRRRWCGESFQQLLQFSLASVASKLGQPTPVDWFPEEEYNALLLRPEARDIGPLTPWTRFYYNQYDKP